MSFKNYTCVNYFFDEFLNNKDHSETLEILSHNVLAIMFEDNNSKELSFFSQMLQLFNIRDLFTFINYFPNCRIRIPSRQKFRSSLYIAYGYYISYIQKEFNIWDYPCYFPYDISSTGTGYYKTTLGKEVPGEISRRSILQSIENFSRHHISDEVQHYYDQLDETDEYGMAETFFVLSSFVYYSIYQGNQPINSQNFFPDLINMFGTEKIEKFVLHYQGKGSSLFLRIPDLNKLREVIIVILTYYLMEFKNMSWETIKINLPLKIDSSRKILNLVKKIRKRIDGVSVI